METAFKCIHNGKCVANKLKYEYIFCSKKNKHFMAFCFIVSSILFQEPLSVGGLTLISQTCCLGLKCLEAPLLKAKEVFENKAFHHIPSSSTDLQRSEEESLPRL